MAEKAILIEVRPSCLECGDTGIIGGAEEGIGYCNCESGQRKAETRCIETQSAELDAAVEAGLEGYDVVDGYIVDPATGEVLGNTEQLQTAEWALRKRAEAHAHGEALRSEMELLINGIRERFELRINEVIRRIEWLDLAHGASIQEYAKALIPAGKKSVHTAWATIGFRSSRESCTVLDAERALAYLEGICPAAIKTERRVLVSQIPDELKPGLPDSVFAFKPAGASTEFYIKHGGNE